MMIWIHIQSGIYNVYSPSDFSFIVKSFNIWTLVFENFAKINYILEYFEFVYHLIIVQLQYNCLNNSKIPFYQILNNFYVNNSINKILITLLTYLNNLSFKINSS